MTNRVLTYFLLFMASAWSAEAAEVRLRSSALCRATVVRLGDVAEIHADDPEVVADLSSIALFPAPAGGASRQLNHEQVRALLSISGVELREVAVTGSEWVVVQSTAIQNTAGATAVRPVQRGLRPYSRVRQASAEEPIARPPQPHTLQSPEPAPPPLVERNDSVTVHSRATGVRITTSGKALGEGAMGEVVSVELADTRMRVLGRVVGPQTVEVTAAGALHSAASQAPGNANYSP